MEKSENIFMSLCLHLYLELPSKYLMDQLSA